MTDLKQRLRSAMDAVPEPDFDLVSLGRSRDRKELRRRVTAGFLGLSIFLVLGVGLFGFMSKRPAGPADGSGATMPQPTTSLAFPDGAYAYTRGAWVRVDADGVVTKVSVDRQTWYGLDASGRIINEGDDPQDLGPGEFETDAGDLTYLSTDPGVLLGQLTERAEPGGASPESYEGWTLGAEAPITAGLVRSIGELFQDDNATPELRAALAQVLAGLEGASVDAHAKDPAGRPAISVQIETERQLHVWWFDRDSLQVSAMTNVDPGADPSSVGLAYLIQGAGFVPDVRSDHPDDPLVMTLTVHEGTRIKVE